MERWKRLVLVLFVLACGLTKGFCTNSSMAGQCRSSTVYKEMTLKGGINAGTYKDVGGAGTMEECQKKCCSFPACDLAFMLAGNCYLVGCKDQKQCAMQPAKESSFKPMISYVTRWNSEGVKHTVLPSGETQYKCPKMNAINKVTLKGGLQAGDFTDIGRVASIGECYSMCCQQEKCDLAFLLGQNCFTVGCKDKRLCVTIPAQPSIFNPQIAYVTKRMLVIPTVKKGDIPKPNLPVINSCPNTRVLENMTLKGGVDAGAYKDHGKVTDILLCRRICCEMTECHLAFMLGSNCFSVKCASVDSCRAQHAKPSAYSPKISYVRKVGTNQLLPNMPTEQNQKEFIVVVTTTTTAPPLVQNGLSAMNMLSSLKIATPSPNSVDTTGKTTTITTTQRSQQAQTASTTTTASPTDELLKALQQQDITTSTTPPKQAIGELHTSTPVTENGTVRSTLSCKLSELKANVTLKGGRKSGEFVEQKDVKNMFECSQKCCKNEKCNLAFMLGNTCYSVKCYSPGLCRTIKAPPTKFYPAVQYVRGLESIQNVAGDDATTETPTQTTTTLETITTTSSTISETITITTASTDSCRSQPIVKQKSIRGGKRAGKFKIFRAINDIDTCIGKCCMLKKDCDVAYMEDDNCYSIQCFKKSACAAVPLRESETNTTFAYMDHFLDKLDEEEAESDLTTELEQTEVGGCGNIEIVRNKTLKGGTRAGKFHPLGKKHMDDCISSCCDRPNCDIAYLLNGHCYSVECVDMKLCQATREPSKSGQDVQLAYMNKPNLSEKQRDYMAIYVIVGSIGVMGLLGSLVWMIYIVKRRRNQQETSQRLLEPEDEEETLVNIMHRKPPPHRSRYRQPRY